MADPLPDLVPEEVGAYSRRASEGGNRLSKTFMIGEPTTEPMVANDNWMEFTVDYKRKRAARDRLFTRILDAFEASDGKASQTLELVHQKKKRA